ncbi:hypothetical protein AVEN_113205-1 [Araneus ventricosus]|uniref:BTB domain-containing protein n=1 Tax=Araneus ventricosus TaxID=182803 RepID=A0A4Y2MDB7_ARAVE|nr:hypothetical protein AVEN_113205-1 [Araneus ventricosus]
MSATTTQSSGVTSVSYSFVLKWTLKAKALNELYKNSGATGVRSDLYQFKTAKDLRFYLEIDNDILDGFSIYIKGSKMWSFELVYAFLVSKERACGLETSHRLSFLNSYSPTHVSDEEDVAIHCVVNACPARPASSAKKVDLSLMECQNTVNFEGVEDITYPSNYTNEMVIDFIRKGDIPNFNIDQAIKIISETNEHKCETLRILSLEYLMNNITAQSIRKISKAAIDFGLPVLERKCLQQIANGRLQIR